MIIFIIIYIVSIIFNIVMFKYDTKETEVFNDLSDVIAFILFFIILAPLCSLLITIVLINDWVIKLNESDKTKKLLKFMNRLFK